MEGRIVFPLCCYPSLYCYLSLDCDLVDQSEGGRRPNLVISMDKKCTRAASGAPRSRVLGSKIEIMSNERKAIIKMHYFRCADSVYSGVLTS